MAYFVTAIEAALEGSVIVPIDVNAPLEPMEKALTDAPLKFVT